MIFETNKDKGRAGLSLGIAWFGANGYSINIPLNDTQWYDFVAEKDGHFYTVQCKATGSKDNAIPLRNFGGTKGSEYDNVTNHINLDFLFCLDKNMNMYVIPFQDLLEAGNKNTIHLRTEKTSQGFQTYQYKVDF